MGILYKTFQTTSVSWTPPQWQSYYPQQLLWIFVLLLHWKLVQWQGYFIYGCKWDLTCAFCISHQIQIKFGTRDVHKLIHICIFHIYCPVGVKSGIRDVHVMLLSVCELCENWCKEGCTFLIAIKKLNDVYLNHKNHMTLHGKECLVKVCVLHRAVHHLCVTSCCTLSVCYIVLYTIFSLVEWDSWWQFCQLHAPATLLQGNSPHWPWTGGWRYGPLRQSGCCGSRDIIAAKWKWVLISWASRV
jgi:hypothetical protein